MGLGEIEGGHSPRPRLPVGRLVGRLSLFESVSVVWISCRCRATREASVGARLSRRGDSPHRGHD